MPTSVSPKGQVTIPSNIRKEWNIQPGDKFDFETDYEIKAIRMVPIKTTKRKKKTWQEELKELQKILKGADLLDSFLKEKREEIAREDGKYTLKNES